jgi:hypothetical protein
MELTAKQKLEAFKAKNRQTLENFYAIQVDFFRLQQDVSDEIMQRNVGKFFRFSDNLYVLVIAANSSKYYGIEITKTDICLNEFQPIQMAKPEATLQEVEEFLGAIERRIAMVRTLNIGGLKEEANLT